MKNCLMRLTDKLLTRKRSIINQLKIFRKLNIRVIAVPLMP
jgi:hypothetical protein